MANRTSLLLPLSKAGLSFKIFADLFLFKGQEENLTLGHSWLWGLALSYGKVLVL